jgi:polar amino acid transport system substrate-binding protein
MKPCSPVRADVAAGMIDPGSTIIPDRTGRWRCWALAAGWLLAIIGTVVCGPAMAQEQTPLRLCADPDNLPFSSNGTTAPGFYIELGAAIAHALGRPFQPVWVPTYYSKRQVRQKMLTSDQCDGFTGVPDDPSFMGPRLIFTHPIVPLGYALVAQSAKAIASPKDLQNLRVAVQFSTPPQDMLATRDDVQMVTVLSPEEAMRDLADGKADAAFIWGPSAGWLNNSLMHGNYRVVPVNDEHLQWNAAIAFPRNRTELRDQVDRALDGLGGTISALAARYGFPVTGPEPAAAGVQTTHAGHASEPQLAMPAAASQTDVAAGHKLFNQNCAHCHGPDAVQGEQRRNLRLLQQRYGDQMPQMFMTTVTHGRVSKGMPNWSGIFTDEEFHKILAFLSSVQEPGS